MVRSDIYFFANTRFVQNPSPWLRALSKIPQNKIENVEKISFVHTEIPYGIRVVQVCCYFHSFSNSQ